MTGQGGIGKMYQLFGDEIGVIIDEMNKALAAVKQRALSGTL
ncbi:MAG: hypothetical protein ACKVE4_10150 [Dissulfuribacterales bacterium]